MVTAEKAEPKLTRLSSLKKFTYTSPEKSEVHASPQKLKQLHEVVDLDLTKHKTPSVWDDQSVVSEVNVHDQSEVFFAEEGAILQQLEGALANLHRLGAGAGAAEQPAGAGPSGPAKKEHKFEFEC